ncbi:two-component system, OmpR family, sensor histidine kinase MprB [Friedmanniella luteola]|uniref:histidine kinase n=1 Tax=Friedmanniella luteola TaxID=546871 RepID=A0A1H2A3E5_9ACTN|nr:HAMP domain-containing sensor histidine kinase [Friedmanniella luteola]SDT40430.1 two-component system, OmpR family, sensor histidine kinase MprB [Friedmanniella luteola]
MPRRLRSWLRGFPLERRVFLLTTLAVAVAVAATGLAAFVTLRVSLYNALDDELIEVASTLAVPVAQDITRLGGLTESALRAGDVSVAAYRADGTPFFVPDEREHLVLTHDELAVARLQRGASARTGVATDGEQYRIVAVPITQLGNYALVLGRPLEPTNNTLRSVSVVLVVFGALGVGLAAVVGATVARSGLRPVRQLSVAVEHVTATDDLEPISIAASGDLALLADTFNRMLTSLASSRERQRQLIADAGHELRTPLTSLRTNIELLTADASTGMLKPADRTAILADVNAQLAEFTSLIGDLVQLAREDGVAASPEPIDLRDVIRSALERVRRRAHGVDFDVELNPYYVIGEAETLERAFTNLLDNAVKWSPAGGTVRVQLEGGRFRVADQGPGIDEADLPFVFDRFFRAEAARNTPGTGLGLSIVAQAVDRHGGWVRASRSAQGGAEFTVQLPGATTFEALSEVRPSGSGASPARRP